MLPKSNQRCFSKTFSIVLIALLPIIQACSGNDSDHKTGVNLPTTQKKEGATSSVTDACSLITEEEAKAVIGGPVKKVMSTPTMCQYLSASDELSKAGESVSIQIEPGAASGFDAYISSAEKNLNVKSKRVSGVGDKAAFAAGQFIVSKGDDFIIVIVGKNMIEEELIAAEKEIAQKAIERLR